MFDLEKCPIFNWKEFIAIEENKTYFKEIVLFLQEDAKKHTIRPSHKNVFNAFQYCPLDKTKVVILGQDPYHGENQAHGLSFSVQPGVDIPPSLKNIFKELKSDLGLTEFKNGCLTSWASQGVLLLNSSLTVRLHEANSHKNIGWETFTDNAIKLLSQQNRPIVFILWGAFARSKKKFITSDKHLVLESAHPSPLSAHNGFFGCKHFSKTNDFLMQNNMQPIDWEIK